MPRSRFTMLGFSAASLIAVVATDACGNDDRAHVSDEFRACMARNADPSTWRPVEPEPVPPGLELRIEGAPLVVVLPAADGGKWLAFAELRFWLPAGVNVGDRIGGAIGIAERALAATSFAELCAESSSERWLERARPTIAAHLAPTPVVVRTRGIYLRRLE
ncbi:MAG: hypothetical protein RIG56_01265 [Thalassobaculum sp.]